MTIAPSNSRADSRVVGSPDPLSPYKVVRAFPKLTIKQP